MPAEFQKAMDRTLKHSKNTFCFLDDVLIVSKGEAKNTFCFLDDILIVSKREAKDHEKFVQNVLQKLDD